MSEKTKLYRRKRVSLFPMFFGTGLLLLILITTLSLADIGNRLTRLSIASAGDRTSIHATVSPDGTKIAFVSDSDFFNQGIHNDQWEIWLYDVPTQTLTRVTTASNTDRVSWGPRFSQDSSKLVFYSDSDFFGTGIANDQDEIWIYNLSTSTLNRVTTASSGDRSSFAPTINADGSLVTFISDSDFLGQGIPNDRIEVWLLNTTTMAYTRLTETTQPDRSSASPQIDASGTKVAFVSDADFLGQGIPFDQPEIWLYDTTVMTLTRVTTASASNRWSYAPSLNAEGTKIAFSSDSDFLGQGIPDDVFEIWLYDIVTHDLNRITSTDISYPFPYSRYPRLNADGSLIVFQSPFDHSGQNQQLSPEIWLYDTQMMAFTQLTEASDLTRDSNFPSISSDGSRVAFHSDSDFLGTGIPNAQYEAWLIERATNAVIEPLSGGALTYVDNLGNETTITVPPNAVTETTTLAFLPLATVNPPTGLNFAQHAFNLEAYRDGVLLPNFEFAAPITISVNYDQAEVNGLDETQLRLMFLDAGVWSESGITVVQRDTVNNRLVVTSVHLSDFAMFAPLLSTERIYLPIMLRNP